MKAAIVTIGDEILIGQITDTNSGYIAKALDKIGIQTIEMISITDDKNHILKTFATYQDQVDVVIITGGLGPTKDDITKKTFCDYFEDVLVSNQDVLAHVKSIIEGIYKRPITQLNIDQALVPSKAKVLFNKVGTAPGMLMQKNNTTYISLPGVPFEMKYLVDNEIIPYLVKTYQRPFIIHKTILTYGQGESKIAEIIEDWENNLPAYIKLAYLPSPGRVRLRLTARGLEENVLIEAVNNQANKLQPLIGDIIVGFEEDQTIEVMIGKKLEEKKQTIATAESCTGGKIGYLISSIAGASSYYKGSLVTYNNQMKSQFLQISHDFINNHGAVSEEVALQMVQNAKQIIQSDYAISVTGNAGPTSGDNQKEVGTVYIGIATPSNTFVEEFNFGQPREKVVERAVNKAMELIYKEILKN
jgi:nicotinamide-nucleotide amidase